jgi:DNA transformation protein and related proteins
MNDAGYISFVIDLMQALGPVSAKRMFGGHGLFLDGTMFALIDDNTLYFKADKKTIADFEQQNLVAFSYQRQNKTCHLSYYQAPEEVFDCPIVMHDWAMKAFEVALRAKRKN